MAVGLLFLCVISVDIYHVTTAEEGDLPLIDFHKWDGISSNATYVSQGVSGSDFNYLCYEWNRTFATRRDIAIPITFQIAADMSLQIFKYSENVEELVGEVNSCMGELFNSGFAIGIANSSGFSVRLRGKTCDRSVLFPVSVTTFYYSTTELSEPDIGDCQPSPCGDPSCFTLSNSNSVGYRCYCKKWYKQSCVPGPQNSSVTNSCNCPPNNFLGETCYMGHYNRTQSDSPQTSDMKTQSPADHSGLDTTKSPGNPSENENESNSVPIAAIAAGAGGGIVIVMVVVGIIILYRHCRSKQLDGNRQSAEDQPGPNSQSNWNVDYKAATKKTVHKKVSMSSIVLDGDQQSNQETMNNDSDGHYAYPYVVGTIAKTSNTYDNPGPAGMPIPEEPFWQPGKTIDKLYAQFEGKRFRILQQSDVQLEKEIGSGEFGTVAKGFWKTPQGLAVVAVKTLNSELADDRVRFLREAAIMGQFKHKNVVDFKGVVLQGAPLMIVLEFMAHGDLREYLQPIRESGQCCVEGYNKTLLRMSREIACGMNYLSKKGFIHRDLAVRNVLLDRGLTCKIGDFGLARDLTHSDYYMTQGGRLPIRWTAPEAIVFHKYSTASDVWGYGIVLYELWTVGERPYGYVWSNNFVMESLQQGYRLPPPAGCPIPMYRLMINCWHPDHHRRPTFNDIVMILDVDEEQLLTNRPADEPIRGKLGDPIDSVFDLYMDLQTTYQKKKNNPL